MFDALQIGWWILQITLVGYLCTYRLLDDDTDRLLYAPITGLAVALLLSSALWLWSFPSHAISFILAVSMGLGLACVIRSRPTPSPAAGLWLGVGCLLLILHGSLIPFAEKLWQGYPLDRFGFLNTHILFQQEKLTYFTDMIARLNYNGEKSSLFIHPVMTAALGEMKSRPACGLVFGSLAWLTPRDLHRLGNAWEVFLRCMQFSCVLALFYKVIRSRFLGGFLAVGTIFGYWFQYQKDYNSWPHMATLALIIGILALLIEIVNNQQATGKVRYLIYLLAVAMVVNHAEFGLVLCLGLAVVVVCTPVLRKEFVFRRAARWEWVACVGLIFLAHPYILSWIHRMFRQSPIMIGGESLQARGLYSLFGSDQQLSEFTQHVVAHPLHLIFNPVALADLVIGSMGLPFVSYAGSRITLGATLLLIALLGFGSLPVQSSRKSRSWLVGVFAFVLTLFGLSFMLSPHFWPNVLGLPALDGSASLILGVLLFSILVTAVLISEQVGLKVLLGLAFFQFVFFIGSLLAFQWFGVLGAGAAYRSVAYWGAFGSMALLLYLGSANVRVFKMLSIIFSVFNLIFGLSVFWVANHGGMETYAKFYPNRAGFRHFEVATVRDKYDFDYLNLVEPLRRCALVYLDFKETQPRGLGRFHAVNLMNFLDNNHIPYRLGFPYLNAYQLLADPYHPGFKKEEVCADCTVDEEIRNGRISYRLTSKEWR